MNALYQSYENTNDKDAFKDKYFGMLEAGGTYTLDDAKRDYGLDIADPAFWNIGLDMIAGMIDELETMVEKRDLKNAPASDLDAPEAGQS